MQGRDHSQNNNNAQPHPFAFAHPGRYAQTHQQGGRLPPHQMDNADPTNEFMYQIPPRTMGQKATSDREIDPDDLDLRLLQIKSLGQQPPPQQLTDPAAHHPDSYSPNDSEPFTPPEFQSELPSADPSPYSAQQPTAKDPLRRWPTVHDPLGPDDSISMFRPPRAGAAPRPPVAPAAPSIRAMRKGGTDVDYGEQVTPGVGGEGYDAFSMDDGVTMNTPKSATYLDHTVAPDSAWTRTDAGPTGMQRMRDRLLAEQASAEKLRQAEIDHAVNDAKKLAKAMAKVDSQRRQLREVESALFSEQIHRQLAESRVASNSESMTGIKNELGSAIRALRSARDDARLNEEERAALKRSFDMAQVQLRKWELEVEVRNARNKGVEEGRMQAFKEAARWMGSNPPLPVDPVDHIPDAVFEQPQHSPNGGGGNQGHANDPHRPQQFSPNVNANGLAPPQGFNSFSSPELRSQYQPMGFPGSNSQTHGSKPGSGYPSQRTSPEDGQQYYSAQPQSSGQQHQGQQFMSPPRTHISQAHTGHATPRHNMPQYTGQQSSLGVPPGAQQPNIHQSVPTELLPPSMRAAQAAYQQGSHSVPHQHAQLPQQPTRAATVGHQHGRPHPPSMQHQTSQPHGYGHTRVQMTPRQNAADDYLDRVDHDPALQHMLSGVNAQSLHTSAYPGTVGGTSDKPLPNPISPSNRARAPSTAMGTHVTHGGKSRRRESLSNGMHQPMMMPTIPDGDRYPVFPGSAPHGGMSQIGHRRTHSRNTSIGTVDPTAYALPASTVHSANATPQALMRQPTSARQTPQSRARSRMAGALRNDGDLAPGELSQIEEEDLTRQRTRSDAGVGPTDRERVLMQSAIMRNMNEQPPSQLRKAPSMPPSRHQPRPIMPSVLGNRAVSEAHHPPSRPRNGHQSSQSMGGTGPRGDDPPFSHPMFVPPGLAPAVVGGGVEDVQGPRHSALGLEGIEAQSGGANALGHYNRNNGKEGSGHASGLGSFFSAIKAPTITIQPPSSQAVSNLQSQVASAKTVPRPLPPHPETAMVPSVPAPKTPTVVASPIIQQPRMRETTTVREFFDDPAIAIQPVAQPREVPLPRSRAGTVTTTAGTAVPGTLGPVAWTGTKQPHDSPLPASRAPTVIGTVQAHHIPLPASRAPTAFAPNTAQAHNIPLPASRSIAPTAYEGSPPDLLSPKTDISRRSHRSTRSTKPPPVQPINVPVPVIAAPVPVVGGVEPISVHAMKVMPNISVIDYAVAQPLPESRATTMFGTPKAATRLPSEVDENTRRNAKTKRKPVPNTLGGNGGEHTQVHYQGQAGNGNGGGGNGFDPRHIPLPASRAPTVARHRASTYARTEGTIDEVTEEKSGRENRGGRKRW